MQTGNDCTSLHAFAVKLWQQNYQNGTVTLQLGVILSGFIKNAIFWHQARKKFVDDKNIVELIQKQQNKEEHGLDTDGMEIPLSGQVIIHSMNVL